MNQNNTTNENLALMMRLALNLEQFGLIMSDSQGIYIFFIIIRFYDINQ